MLSLFLILLILSTQTSSFKTSTTIHTTLEYVKNTIQSKILETKLNIHRKLPLIPDEDQIHISFCNASLAFSQAKPFQQGLPILYIITPTYTRREQVVEMVRMSHTLLHLNNIVWIIAEDSQKCSPLVEKMLQRFKIPYVHLVSPMPKMYAKEKYKPRGVASRRAGVDWVLKNHPKDQDGVVYFADDDNTYDLSLFDEIRKTKKVSVFPVGFVGSKGSPGITSPIVLNGKVTGFSDDWFASRMFPVDMAGFAINVNFLASRTQASMPFWAGYEEDVFIQTLDIKLDELEPLANECTEILVWHTKTVSEKTPKVKITKHLDSNLKQLVDDAVFKGISVYDAKSKNELKYCFDGNRCEKYSNLWYMIGSKTMFFLKAVMFKVFKCELK